MMSVTIGFFCFLIKHSTHTNISRNSRINWPGNSVYLYHPPSNEQVYAKETRQHEASENGGRHKRFMQARVQWVLEGLKRAGVCAGHAGR
jgi:hypothetical protein